MSRSWTRIQFQLLVHKRYVTWDESFRIIISLSNSFVKDLCGEELEMNIYLLEKIDEKNSLPICSWTKNNLRVEIKGIVRERFNHFDELKFKYEIIRYRWQKRKTKSFDLCIYMNVTQVNDWFVNLMDRSRTIWFFLFIEFSHR